MKYLPVFFLSLVIALSFVHVTHAAGFGSLVTCGQYDSNLNGPPDPNGAKPCTINDLWYFLANIVKFLTEYIGIPLATLGVGVGGFYMIVGSSSQGMRTKGKDIIFASIIGLFIALAAFVIVNTVLKELGATNIVNPLKQS